MGRINDLQKENPIIKNSKKWLKIEAVLMIATLITLYSGYFSDLGRNMKIAVGICFLILAVMMVITVIDLLGVLYFSASKMLAHKARERFAFAEMNRIIERSSILLKKMEEENSVYQEDLRVILEESNLRVEKELDRDSKKKRRRAPDFQFGAIIKGHNSEHGSSRI